MNVCMGVLYMGEGLEGLGTNRSLGGPPKSFTLQLQLSFRFFIEKKNAKKVGVVLGQTFPQRI